MSEFISFPEAMGDIEVSVEITASLQDIVSLLLVINFASELGIEEVNDLSGIYQDLMQQVSVHGIILEDGDIDND